MGFISSIWITLPSSEPVRLELSQTYSLRGLEVTYGGGEAFNVTDSLEQGLVREY
jgi:hypothetical protein